MPTFSTCVSVCGLHTQTLFSHAASLIVFGSGPAPQTEGWEADSDEEVLEKILKLHPQVFANKQLFSIPEVTEEEDNSESELQAVSMLSKSKGCFLCPTASGQCQPCRDKAKVAWNRGSTQVRPQHGLTYIDTVDTSNYEEDEETDLDSESSLYLGPSSKDVTPQRSLRARQERDRLRREALLRNHMTSHINTSGEKAHEPYMLSRTVRHIKTPAMEIDVEYGTDNDDDSSQFDPGEVVVEEMSSEWWVEGGNQDYHHSLSPRQCKLDSINIMASGHHQWVCCITCPATVAQLGINPSLWRWLKPFASQSHGKPKFLWQL